MTPEEIARAMCEHPALNTAGADPFETNLARADWIAAARDGLEAIAVARDIDSKRGGLGGDDIAELFARIVYEHPAWGYKRGWQRGRADCARFFTAARDVLSGAS